jgi:hypothetical protein
MNGFVICDLGRREEGKLFSIQTNNSPVWNNILQLIIVLYMGVISKQMSQSIWDIKPSFPATGSEGSSEGYSCSI